MLIYSLDKQGQPMRKGLQWKDHSEGRVRTWNVKPDLRNEGCALILCLWQYFINQFSRQKKRTV